MAVHHSSARTVHLRWTAPAEVTVLYGEVTPFSSARGTLFNACGFASGKLGLVELPNCRKGVSFSIDSVRKKEGRKANGVNGTNGHNSDGMTTAANFHILRQGYGVDAGHFETDQETGVEATCMYDWAEGQKCKFLLKAVRSGSNPGEHASMLSRTIYAGYFFNAHQRTWIHMATFSVSPDDEPALICDPYSSVEDLRQYDNTSYKDRRSAAFGGGWVVGSGTWEPLARAVFTADGDSFASNVGCEMLSLSDTRNDKGQNDESLSLCTVAVLVTGGASPVTDERKAVPLGGRVETTPCSSMPLDVVDIV